MLVNMNEVLKKANDNGYAVGAFNVTNLEGVQAVVEAAEEMNQAVIMEFANAAHGPLIALEHIGPIMVQYAKQSSVPICVHLDHGSSIEECVRGIQLGFSSIMFDDSAAPFAENLKDTALMVRIAHYCGVTVEAELGNIHASDIGVGEGTANGTLAESYENIAGMYTNPEVAQEFVEHTGVDTLAIAFGTAHGLYTVKPILDLERIKAVHAKVSVPLVMHGGSGLSDDEYRTAIHHGIRKINYYTYMSLYAGKVVKDAMDQQADDAHIFFHDISRMGKNAMKEDIKRVIKVFSLGG